MGDRLKSLMKMSDLLGQILSKENVLQAYFRVVKNKGAPGIDGVTIKDLSLQLRMDWERISQEIKEGKYRPQSVKGVKIPKPNGGERQLGIPTVMDRLIQQCIHQVLSKVYEPEFSNYSYGFRPNRNAHQALFQARDYINSGYQDVIDLDLKSFFDRIDHDKMMGLLRCKIKDKMLLRLIRRYLCSPMVRDGVVSLRSEGTPQGGPLSPLLSNILLNELDQELERRGHKFVRYADDCSIFLKSKRAAQRVLGSITNFLEKRLKLAVNEEKTSVCRPLKFVLLGHGFVSSYKKEDKGKYRLCIAKKSWKRLKEKIKIITRKTLPMSIAERTTQLNNLMYGWVNYFQHATGYQKLKDLDAWIRSRLRYCIWKQWKRPRRRFRAFIQLGIEISWARRFAWSRLGGWRIACSPIMKVSVPRERLEERGYRSFLDYYLWVKHRKKKK